MGPGGGSPAKDLPAGVGGPPAPVHCCCALQDAAGECLSAGGERSCAWVGAWAARLPAQLIHVVRWAASGKVGCNQGRGAQGATD